jgi:glycosyltransferase involved in cell wall biosynthesis
MSKGNYKSKILLLVPSPESMGGIVNYFKVIKPRFSLPVDYFLRGVRRQHSLVSRIAYPLIQLIDYARFFVRMCQRRYQLVQINTSFGYTGIIRDYFFIKILSLFKIKYIVFFRGIDEKVIKKIEGILFDEFKSTFLRAGIILVLSNDLKKKLLTWGTPSKIFVESTVVDEKLLASVNEGSIASKFFEQEFTLLFLARLEKEKGVYEALQAFRVVRSKYPRVSLKICGFGSEYQSMKKRLERDQDNSIILTGHVSGESKINAFWQSHIYLFPSSHREGLPNSLLEAMAFGLPVVTTRVGGIPDFFIHGAMGFMVDSSDPEKLADAVLTLLNDKTAAMQMSLNNYHYARTHFYSKVVVDRLESYYSELLNDDQAIR